MDQAQWEIRRDDFAIFLHLWQADAYPQRQSRCLLKPVLGSRCTYSGWPATVANEHGNRADRANDEGRRADHSADYTKGFDGGALQ